MWGGKYAGENSWNPTYLQQVVYHIMDTLISGSLGLWLELELGLAFCTFWNFLYQNVLYGTLRVHFSKNEYVLVLFFTYYTFLVLSGTNSNNLVIFGISGHKWYLIVPLVTVIYFFVQNGTHGYFLVRLGPFFFTDT